MKGRGPKHPFPSTAPEPRPGGYTPAIAALALVATAFVVYAPALTAGFIWDDGRAITNNLAFQAPHPLYAIWTGRGDPDYLPLKSTILWLLYRIFGDHTSPYHVFNVAVHAANGVVLWRVLRKLAVSGAWLGGLVFLVHPTHVESVAWVSECKNTLSTLFGLLALLVWLRNEDQRHAGRYLASLALFTAGLLCKSHLVILPPTLLLCAWWRQRQPGEPAPSSGPWSRGVLVRASAFFLVAGLLGAITVHFQYRRAIAEYRLPVGGLASRLANAGKATWWYLGKAVSPTNLWYEMPARPVETEPEALAVLAGTRGANPAPAWPRGRLTLWPLAAIYPRWRVTSPVWYDYLPALAMAGAVALAIRYRRGRGRGVCFGLGYFLLALLPVLGLLKMSYMRAAWVADHFQYLADIGIVALGCAGGTRLWQWAKGPRRWLVGVAATAVIGGYAATAFARAADFRSEYTLWTDTVAKNPEAWQAQVRLGAALLARGDAGRAVVRFQHGARLKPDNADAQNNLGLALVTLGRIDEGIAHYRESLRLDDRQFFAYANLGDALAGQRRYAEAVDAYRAAIRLRPRLAPLHYRLGQALIERGQLEEGLASLLRADALVPHNPEITAALARARRLRLPAPAATSGPSDAAAAR